MDSKSRSKFPEFGPFLAPCGLLAFNSSSEDRKLETARPNPANCQRLTLSQQFLSQSMGCYCMWKPREAYCIHCYQYRHLLKYCACDDCWNSYWEWLAVLKEWQLSEIFIHTIKKGVVQWTIVNNGRIRLYSSESMWSFCWDLQRKTVTIIIPPDFTSIYKIFPLTQPRLHFKTSKSLLLLSVQMGIKSLADTILVKLSADVGKI